MMFQKVLFDDSVLHYGEFMNDLSKILVSYCALVYFCSVDSYFDSFRS